MRALCNYFSSWTANGQIDIGLIDKMDVWRSKEFREAALFADYLRAHNCTREQPNKWAFMKGLLQFVRLRRTGCSRRARIYPSLKAR
jgi:hypothetical protein